MMEIALVAHLFPALGDPREMPVRDFDAILATVPDVLEAVR